MAHTLDGDLTDWTSADRLDLPGTGTSGYQLYGRIENQGIDAAPSYVFALKSPVAISDNTTFWLNTDQNSTTGLQAFAGAATGAEYYVNFVDGLPYLYDSTNAYVGPVSSFAFNADKTAIEFSIPLSTLKDTTPGLDLKVDVNNAAFLPANYASTTYTISDPASLPAPTAHTIKIGIVYSATTASQYFGGTTAGMMAYSQLFMAAQNQATAAGVPFDVLSEADLKDLSKISGYDALVFPSFRNVAAADADQIQSVLTKAVYKYHVGLVTAGDFMTNDEHGAALGSDPYVRMKTLLDLQRDGGTTTAGGDPVDVTATGVGFAGYQPNEAVRHYNTMSTSWYTSADGTAPTVIANQSVTEGGSTTSHESIVGTVTGAKNVHFANESLLGDNNMLQHAIEYVVDPATGPIVSLHMSRDKAIVASRTDMDQAKEPTDVKPENGSPGIYDKLLPILDAWKAQYNFVGSYYIDVGDGTGGSQTNWTVSKPYYDHLLAAGNEIGSHSITHPEDTNVLTAAQFQYEFGGSKTTIEQHLGITVDGAAVPGMPEFLPTSKAIEQYYTYITGGATLVGAGYPGAIGHLTPDDSKIYIAPNDSFDYTLIGYQHLTPDQAEAAWATEWATNTTHSDLPIVVWPWHDYGPTNWVTDENTPPAYTTQMFTDFIKRAYDAGSEFVTLDDLAQRVANFDKSTLQYSYDATAKIVTATVGTADAGKFALDLSGLDAGSVIKSVAGYYAYDADSVFVDKDGGTFSISLGGAADGVTHLTKIADRAELVSVTGDGASLTFSVVGEGTFLVDLKDPTTNDVKVTSAAGTDMSTTLVGDQLTVTLTGLGSHTVSIVETPNNHPPVVAAALTAALTEGGAPASYDLLQGASDPDPADAGKLAVADLTYRVGLGAATSAAPAGFVYDATTHLLTVDPGNAAYGQLALGATQTMVVGYNVVDTHGGKVAQTETITITGVDNPSGGTGGTTGTGGITGGGSAGGGAGAGSPSGDGMELGNRSGTGGTTGGGSAGGGAGAGAGSPSGDGMELGNRSHFGTVSHDPHSAAGEVYALFDALFDRTPDMEGQRVWTGALNAWMSLHDVSQALLQSTEGQSHLGVPDNLGFVQALYQSALHRQGDAGGVQVWLNELQHGLDRADVAMEFALSPENLSGLQPAFDTGVFTPNEQSASVARLFYGLLERAPDAGGIDAFTHALAGGASLQNVADIMIGSSEYATKFGGLSDAAFIQTIYENALGRQPEGGGLQTWTNALAAGHSRSEVAVSVSESTEAHQHYLGQIESGWHLA